MEERVRMNRAGVGTALLALSALFGGCATLPSPIPEPSPTPVTGAVVSTPAAETSSVTATVGPLAATPVAPMPAASAAEASSPASSAVSKATGAARGPSTPPTAEAPDASLSSAPMPPTAQAAPRPVDPLQPDAKIDFDDDKSHADLWLRVRKGFAMPDLEGALVRREEQWYKARPDYVERMMERGSRYLFHIVGEVEKREFPTELALLPFIESAFNPQARSSAKATGMWQFMPDTGRHFELKQNVFRDDRRDVLASTRAALDYLGQLYSTFGDWRLALAAYNWGEGNVQRAIAVNRRAGRPTDYLSLRLPNETRSYVPKLQAVKNIVSRPEDFGLTLPPLDNHPYFLRVPIEHDIDVEVASRLAELPIEEFRDLNPQMNGPVILAAGTPQILLPYDNANAFVRRAAQHSEPLASWTAWVAPRTLRPSDAARQVGMSEETLREINDIPSGMLVRAGSTLLIERSEHRHANVSEHIADNATISFTPDPAVLRRHALRVGRKGDSVAGVARRYGLSTAQVARWNGVGESSRFRAGQTVVVFLPQRAAAAKSRSPAAGTASRNAKARPVTAARPAARTPAAKKPAAARTTVARQ
jgi:membrane-bound lytic murein transglycosylase D